MLAVDAPAAAPSPYAVYLSSQAPSSAVAQHASIRSLLREWKAERPDPHRHPWHLWTPAHLSAARAYLCANRAPATAQRLYSAIRRILRECYRASLIDRDRWEKLDMCEAPPRPPPSVERAPSSAEVRALFLAAEDQPLALARRNAALLALAYGCGLRRRELVSLSVPGGNVFSLDDFPAELEVMGKGGTPRLVPVPDGARAAIGDYLATRELLLGNNWRASRALLLATNGNGTTYYGALAYASIDRALEALCAHAGVPRYSAHDLRRAYCSELLRAGADLSRVQRLMGHRSMATTAIYDRRGDDALRAAAELLIVPYRAAAIPSAALPPSPPRTQAAALPPAPAPPWAGPPCFAACPILGVRG